MSFHWCDNGDTTIFTPRDYQVELLASAFERNTMVCLGHKSSKDFIAFKLLQELARQARQAKKISVYLTLGDPQSMYDMINHLSDLKVYKTMQADGEQKDFVELPLGYQVLILHPTQCYNALSNKIFQLKDVHLLVLEDCHEAAVLQSVKSIFKCFYRPGDKEMPKVLGLAGPLHSASCSLAELSAMLNTLEESVQCKTETASDIVTVLRYCAKPIEFIVQCAPYEKDELANVLEEIICTRKAFLKNHRYDPTEIYNTEEFLDELKSIPDPKKEPLEFLDTTLAVLHEMGPWCANRVAIHFYHRIEKLKVKTPHERHFLLLCLTSTTLQQFHTVCEITFFKFNDQARMIEQYASPKVLRLLEVLRCFEPEEPDTFNETIRQFSHDLETVNFQKLTRSLENSCQSVDNFAKKPLESRSIIDNLDPIVKEPAQPNISANSKGTKAGAASTERRQQQPTRPKRRVQSRRQMRENEAADTLCGIIFCNNNSTARILFDMLLEMSRNDPKLKFLKCQFTVDRVADPIAESKEAENEHRRQEEVLKRFRMHDCNLLIGTSVLEEGIDVPKCNLVVRWDPPTTYRSYVQCKGRAKAVPAYHVTLVAAPFDTNSVALSPDKEQLSDWSHLHLCNNQLDSSSDSESEDTESEHEDNRSQNSTKKPFTIASSKGIVKVLNPEVITSKPPTANELILKEIKEVPVNGASNSLLPKNPFENVLNVVELMANISGTKAELHSTYESKVRNARMRELGKKRKNAIKKLMRKQFSCLIDKKIDKSKDMPNNSPNIKMREMEVATNEIVDQLAQYREIERMLLEKCANTEPADSEHRLADEFTRVVEPYKPRPELLTGASVDLGTAIGLVNKYCSKLPSDTFTKLTALWRCVKTKRNNLPMYQCTLRLPINSPLKYDIVGLPMPTHILARRIVALQTCVELHKLGELDDNLQPIGKEGFKAIESDWENFDLESEDEKIVMDNSEPRPGTTKRRQYYYKRIASELCDCRPTVGVPCYLYFIDLTLQCPIPEEQNTRGRKIYPPENASQGFGILTLKKIPKVSSFPIFTRSGEVKVSIELSKKRIMLDEAQIGLINTFLNYTFTNVLRLKKFLMLFDPESTVNCVFIVPTIKSWCGKVIDWDFLNEIERNANKMPMSVPTEDRERMEFSAKKFKDAVVMPWYRNQDQPQYFYVAEICRNLSPLSKFPGDNYETFKHYYAAKYNLEIQNSNQPLLDVDHTSARLNFLTPRYVNRKGVALPTSSEETKRAKRENLNQKQILVPELCAIHAFPASLWRTAVCLPCILYRINGLLLADDIRKKVSADIGLGQQDVGEDYEWPMLDFGWSLSEVLRKSKESQKSGEQQAVKPEAKKKNGMIKTEDAEEPDKQANNAPAPDETDTKAEKSANEIIIEAEKKLQDSNFIEIGTWSNEMAEGIESNDDDSENSFDEFMHNTLPPNVSLCNSKVARIGSPSYWEDENEFNSNKQQKPAYFSYKDISNHTTKSKQKSNPFVFFNSNDSLPSMYNGCAGDDSDDDGNSFRIAFRSKNEAESIDTEEEIIKHFKQLSILHSVKANERSYQRTKNLQVGYNFFGLLDEYQDERLANSVTQFRKSTDELKSVIKFSGMLVKHTDRLQIQLPKKEAGPEPPPPTKQELLKTLMIMLPYVPLDQIEIIAKQRANVLTISDLENLNLEYVAAHKDEVFEVEGCGDVFDSFNDKHNLKLVPKSSDVMKTIRINFEKPAIEHALAQPEPVNSQSNNNSVKGPIFSFDYQPNLTDHPGPSPSIILQALTMSNANDGINLERLETIGDSFLKYAITTYLYITYENVHEGKLSHLRSKQVANLNLYRLGRRKMLGDYMIATKFEPHDNWLPPCYYVPKLLEKALMEARIPPHHWKLIDLPNIKKMSSDDICEFVKKKAEELGLNEEETQPDEDEDYRSSTVEGNAFPCFMPYNLVTQHSIPDKSIADCVEALIGAYLIECGSRGALLFMAWLGIRVLPTHTKPYDAAEKRVPGSTPPDADKMIRVYGEWAPPKSPLLRFSPHAEQELEYMLDGFSEFEAILGYEFKDRSYLLQAMTHASYSPNRLTDCYQRLEFLGDAVLDYLITRHLYEDPRQHSPGALTDLRSALVNNTIFASLAVRHGFHKYFRHLSPGLNEVIDRFVRIQNENGHIISEEYYLLSEEECDDAEDVEVPKALGDVFESIAGAIFLDSNMSLDVVWKVYSNMMKPEIEQFSNSVPKSPIRELLELEPETAKFGKPEKLADGRRVRVSVEVFSKGTFRGIGRNYRIAKCTAAKCALRQLKRQGLIAKKD